MFNERSAIKKTLKSRLLMIMTNQSAVVLQTETTPQVFVFHKKITADSADGFEHTMVSDLLQVQRKKLVSEQMNKPVKVHRFHIIFDKTGFLESQISLDASIQKLVSLSRQPVTLYIAHSSIVMSNTGKS